MAALHALCFTAPRPWSEAEFASLLTDPATLALSGPESLLLARTVLDEAELLTLAVHPAARRRGLARALLADFHRLARARGAAQAFLEVAADNSPAILLYTAAGYATAGRRRGYYRNLQGAPVDALVLRKPLSGG